MNIQLYIRSTWDADSMKCQSCNVHISVCYIFIHEISVNNFFIHLAGNDIDRK